MIPIEHLKPCREARFETAQLRKVVRILHPVMRVELSQEQSGQLAQARGVVGGGNLFISKRLRFRDQHFGEFTKHQVALQPELGQSTEVLVAFPVGAWKLCKQNPKGIRQGNALIQRHKVKIDTFFTSFTRIFLAFKDAVWGFT